MLRRILLLSLASVLIAVPAFAGDTVVRESCFGRSRQDDSRVVGILAQIYAEQRVQTELLRQIVNGQNQALAQLPSRLPEMMPAQEPSRLPQTMPQQEPSRLPQTMPSQEPSRLPSLVPSQTSRNISRRPAGRMYYPTTAAATLVRR